MLTRIAPLAGLLAVVLLAQPVPAQTLYKSVTPDGRTVYSDKPPPDAVKTEKKDLNTSKLGVTGPSTREKAALRQMEMDRRAREGAQDRVRKAEISLHDAEVALSMGKEPQANERLGTAGKGQRLTDGYWARQKRLEDAVVQARSNLEKVRSGK
jgi:hypothetical protein